KEQRALLERLNARHPDNAEVASALAVVYEKQGETARCEKLLMPHLKRLGTSEGARILGRILAQKGKFEEAHALLAPYAEENLKLLHEAEEGYQQAVQRAWQKVVAEVNSGQA